MQYISIGNKVIDNKANCKVAIANNEDGATALCKILNHYFSGSVTNNEAISMMHKYTAKSLCDIADFLKKHKYTGDMAVEYLREISEELNAQSLVVSLRDELKFDKPI